MPETPREQAIRQQIAQQLNRLILEAHASHEVTRYKGNATERRYEASILAHVDELLALLDQLRADATDVRVVGDVPVSNTSRTSTDRRGVAAASGENPDPSPDQPEPVVCHVSELRQGGEENDGPLESTDLFVKGRGMTLLCNIEVGATAFTYSFSVDGKHQQNGTVGLRAEGQPPPKPDCEYGDCKDHYGDPEAWCGRCKANRLASTALAEMRRASAAIDEADSPLEYQTRCVALALVARQYLRNATGAEGQPPQDG